MAMVILSCSPAMERTGAQIGAMIAAGQGHEDAGQRTEDGRAFMYAHKVTGT